MHVRLSNCLYSPCQQMLYTSQLVKLSTGNPAQWARLAATSATQQPIATQQHLISLLAAQTLGSATACASTPTQSHSEMYSETAAVWLAAPLRIKNIIVQSMLKPSNL
jgi:hypothetical protein